VKFEGGSEDRELPEKLKAEAEGILAWAVLGCHRWLAEGLGDPNCVKLATSDYRTNEDRLVGFITERCTIDKTAETRTGELFQAYMEFCEHFGEGPMTLTSFGKALEERGFPKRKGRFVMRQGIALIPEWGFEAPK
jgi:putative DNA primase/helicase